VLKLKNFISTFFACGVAIFIFANIIFTNIWAMVVFGAFILAVVITVFINQESRIEELEKKMKQLLHKKQD